MKKTLGTTEQSSVVDLNFGLVKVASASAQSRSSPSGSWQKLFYFQLKTLVMEDGKKLFAGNLDTSPPARLACI
jgi:hypothetical protein